MGDLQPLFIIIPQTISVETEEIIIKSALFIIRAIQGKCTNLPRGR